jgi:hypothetical protein
MTPRKKSTGLGHRRKAGPQAFNDPTFQANALKRYARYLGWKASYHTVRDLRDKAERAIDRELEAERRVLADEHQRTPRSERLEIKLDLRRVERQLMERRKRPTLWGKGPPLWELKDPKGNLVHVGLSTHKAYTILVQLRYLAWEDQWSDLTAEGQYSRVREFAARQGLFITARTDPAAKGCGPFKDDRRRWNFWCRETRRKLHPVVFQGVLGINPDAGGIDSDQVREFMRRAGWYRGGYDLPDGILASKEAELVFLGKVLPLELCPYDVQRKFQAPQLDNSPTQA